MFLKFLYLFFKFCVIASFHRLDFILFFFFFILIVGLIQTREQIFINFNLIWIKWNSKAFIWIKSLNHWCSIPLTHKWPNATSCISWRTRDHGRLSWNPHYIFLLWFTLIVIKFKIAFTFFFLFLLLLFCTHIFN